MEISGEPEGGRAKGFRLMERIPGFYSVAIAWLYLGLYCREEVEAQRRNEGSDGGKERGRKCTD